MKRVIRFLVLFLLLNRVVLAGISDFKIIKEAKEAYKNKEFTKSEILLKKLHRDNPQLQYDLGNAYYKMHNYNKALLHYKRAKGDGVDEHARLHNIGNCYFKKGELRGAIKAYEASLKISDDAQTKYNLALAKKLLNKKKKHNKKKNKKQQKKPKQKQSNNKNKKENKNNKQDNNKDKNSKNSQKKSNKDDKKNTKGSKSKNQDKSSKNSQNKNRDDKKSSKQNSNSNKEKSKQTPKQEPNSNSSNRQKPTQREKANYHSNPQREKPKEAKGVGGSKGGIQKPQKRATARIKRDNRLQDKELKHLMKQLGGEKMPTLMYQTNRRKTSNNPSINPW